MSAGTVQVSTLRDHLEALKRRKWLIMLVALIATWAGVVFSLRQEPLYRASAEVLLSRQNLAATLTGTADPAASSQTDRIAETRARLAATPQVAALTLQAAGVTDRTAKDLLERSEVTAEQNVDLLRFSVTDPERALASRLATAYAREFTVYLRQVDSASLVGVQKELQQRIRELEASGDRRSPLYVTLVAKMQELQTMEALQTASAFLMRGADGAKQVQPRPVRNGLLGLGLGLVLAVGLAFLRETLDTRVRSVHDIANRLGLPLLARVPGPRGGFRRKSPLVLLAEPESAQAEAFRMLVTNLEFVNIERDAHAVMVTSAVQAEGKSTTAANLAIALARTGKRVVLVDLDLRHPSLDRLFSLEGGAGLTSVVLGRVELEKALAIVPVTASAFGGSGSENGNGDGSGAGLLGVLSTGPIPPDPGEFVKTQPVGDLLGHLRELADVVVIDAPPLLHVGDAMALSAKVDGLIVVARLNVLRRPMLGELRRTLDACPAAKLGFVVTGAELEDGGYGGHAYGYGYHSGYDRAPSPTEWSRMA